MLNAHVLVIEDDESVRDGTYQLLRSWGCACDTADSIEEAIDQSMCRMPDLLISDYRLRGHRSGLEAIAQVRKVTRTDLPAMLITGDTAPDRLREAIGSGITVLHKPVSASQLYRGIVTALA
jgi:DNA-binding NtrC family response regulator